MELQFHNRLKTKFSFSDKRFLETHMLTTAILDATRIVLILKREFHSQYWRCVSRTSVTVTTLWLWPIQLQFATTIAKIAAYTTQSSTSWVETSPPWINVFKPAAASPISSCLSPLRPNWTWWPPSKISQSPFISCQSLTRVSLLRT